MFNKGDLVRLKNFTGYTPGVYGIVINVMPVSLNIYWAAGRHSWVRRTDLYLIARGQNGPAS
tara:strand:+ start:6531 stop:6716 length:186 start_codon:yes stop_codon:yes gene_type:complete